jgi:hypothetical protein
MNQFSVKTTETDVTILFDGNEVLYWTQEEWIEDPSVVIAIINAVTQAYTAPDKLFAWLEQQNMIDTDK